LPWPIIVAAIIVYRYGPDIISAALRKIEARSEKGSDSHAGLAASAASIAAETSEGEAVEYVATIDAWSDGFFWVDMVEVLI
jgi:hypothetical protein